MSEVDALAHCLGHHFNLVFVKDVAQVLQLIYLFVRLLWDLTARYQLAKFYCRDGLFVNVQIIVNFFAKVVAGIRLKNDGKMVSIPIVSSWHYS